MNTKPVSFQEAFAAIVDPDAMIWAFDKAMYRHWKTNNAGNAKSRRRWRRRDIPNTQRGLCRTLPTRWRIDDNALIGPRLEEIVP
jgi:hypothetical protein